MPAEPLITLYYNSLCRKCRDISRFVVFASFGIIKRIPLTEWDDIIKFYEKHPKAKGYPILFIKSKPIYGAWVFIAVPLAVAYSWWHHFMKLLKIN